MLFSIDFGKLLKNFRIAIENLIVGFSIILANSLLVIYI